METQNRLVVTKDYGWREGGGGEKRVWLLKGSTRNPCADETVLSFDNSGVYTNLHM